MRQASNSAMNEGGKKGGFAGGLILYDLFIASCACWNCLFRPELPIPSKLWRRRAVSGLPSPNPLPSFPPQFKPGRNSLSLFPRPRIESNDRDPRSLPPRDHTHLPQIGRAPLPPLQIHNPLARLEEAAPYYDPP